MKYIECVYVMYMRPKTALLYTDSITVHCNCQKIIHDELLQCCSLHRSEHGGCRNIWSSGPPVQPSLAKLDHPCENWSMLRLCMKSLLKSSYT